MAFSLILFISSNIELYVFVWKILNKSPSLTNLSRYYSIKILGFSFEEWFLRMCDAFDLAFVPNLQGIF